jgi:hypothetical protein
MCPPGDWEFLPAGMPRQGSEGVDGALAERARRIADEGNEIAGARRYSIVRGARFPQAATLTPMDWQGALLPPWFFRPLARLQASSP